MQVLRFSCLLMLGIASCGPAAPPEAPPAASSSLSAAQKNAIGKKIWQNECGGTVDGLTTWNAGEEFPSLGIGHFIWYPAGFNGRWTESWPQFVAYARKHGVQVPEIGTRADAPWSTKAQFQAQFNGAEMSGLRRWLASNVTLQTDFIIARSQAALPKILAAAPAADRARIKANYEKVATTTNGTYALIDYVNFKGDGTNTTERYNGQGWGLLQVLQGMKNVPSGQAAAAEFAASSKRALDRRIANSPPARGESRWRAGWHNRCDTYARSL
ncbi:conserved hypothetical protein [Haloferula helveola]|uniref:Uncharacterized protein n=1 Tax=Haloferula helveola TaxID=490095 RepID=A0ABM7R9X5_9BACT|nr:conserved hypothetical protein [Haloferula helveola]